MFRITPSTPEPPHGSVIMAEGPTGTAFQRFFNDGLYHGTNGKVVKFDYFTKRYNPARTGDFILYTAPID